MGIMTIFTIAAKAGIDDIITALIIMGKGMLGIFIALTIIYLFVLLLNKVFPEKKKEISESDEAAEEE